MPKSLNLVRSTLTNLIEVYAGDFDPEQFFADASRHDLMKLAVQLGRDGAITVDRVMEYVSTSYELTPDDAVAFAMKLFRTLQRLSTECELPFSFQAPTTRRPTKPRSPKGKRLTPTEDAPQAGRHQPANSPLSKFVTMCGGDKEAAKTLADAIKMAGTEKRHGAIGRAFDGLAVMPGGGFLKKLSGFQRTYIVGKLGIDAKKVLKGKE